MFTNRESVMELLKSYPQMKQRANILRYEHSHPAQVSEQEVIGALALARPWGGGGQAGHISDKTMRIAATFRDEQERLNYAAVMDISEELVTLEARIAKLEFYVAQLAPDQSEVIRKYYFERKSWPELQQELMLSRSTLIKRRDSGIDALVEMGKYMNKVYKAP